MNVFVVFLGLAIASISTYAVSLSLNWSNLTAFTKWTGVLFSVVSTIFLITSIQRVKRLELYTDKLVFVKTSGRHELEYSQIERLHLNPQTGKLRIESRQGDFYPVKVSPYDLKSVMRRLETAVYGTSV